MSGGREAVPPFESLPLSDADIAARDPLTAFPSSSSFSHERMLPRAPISSSLSSYTKKNKVKLARVMTRGMIMDNTAT